MDIRQALLEEHSRAQCDRITAFIGNDKKRFARLIHLFFNEEYRIVQRAAWPLSYCVRHHPGLIKPYFKRMLDNLDKPGRPDAVLRNTVRLLQDVDIPKRYHGQLMVRCFEFVASNDKAIAIKAFALSILHQLSKAYPEIVPELVLLIRERWQHETPAFRSRAKRFLKEMAPGGEPFPDY